MSDNQHPATIRDYQERASHWSGLLEPLRARLVAGYPLTDPERQQYTGIRAALIAAGRGMSEEAYRQFFGEVDEMARDVRSRLYWADRREYVTRLHADVRDLRSRLEQQDLSAEERRDLRMRLQQAAEELVALER